MVSRDSTKMNFYDHENGWQRNNNSDMDMDMAVVNFAKTSRRCCASQYDRYTHRRRASECVHFWCPLNGIIGNGMIVGRVSVLYG